MENLKVNSRVRLRGFTLIELMIVVAIIGILAVIAVPKFADMVRRSQEGSTKGSLGVLRSALEIYSAANEGIFPIQVVYLAGPMGWRYLAKMPTGYLPPYHASNLSVFTCYVNGTPYVSELDPACAPSIETMGSSWLYMPYSPDAGGSAVSANFFVSCTHTDSKGIVWTQY